MRIGLKTLAFALASTALFSGCKKEKMEMTRMKCEYVVDGDRAVIYGKGLKGCEKVIFPGRKEAKVVAEESNDTMLTVIVPHGTSSGKILLFGSSEKEAEAVSSFLFRDNRGVIVNFNDRLATWGGYDPMDDEGEPVRHVRSVNDSVLELPVAPPAGPNGSYCLFYEIYDKPWTMLEPTFLQYVAKREEGGRGRESIAGDFASFPNRELCLKFEVFIPKECPWKKQPRIEIFFGPYDCANKHGREISPIAFWEPYLNAGEEGYYTDGWETVTIPLTAFTHDYRSADAKFEKHLNLKDATNFTFVAIGDPGDEPSVIYMCVDNFRIVPIK